MNRFLSVFLLLATCLPALGQTVKQSGNVTPGHAVSWTTNGIIQDAGTAANGFLSSLGVVGQGQTICQRTAAITAPAYQELCWNLSDANGVSLNIQNYGTDTPQPFTIVLNGTTYSFPYTIGGIVGPVSSTTGDVALFNNTSGSLLSDSGVLGSDIALLDGNNIFTGNSSFTGSNTFTGDIIGPLTITPAANSTNQGFNISQSSGTGSVVGPLSFNEIDVLDNSTVTGGATQVAGLRINYNVGGAGVTTGPRIAAYFNMLDSITGTGTADKIGAVGSCDVTVADTSGGGGCYGLNAFAGVAATGSASRLIGFESDVTIATGGTATNRYAFSAVNVAPGNGQGSTLDSVMFVANFVAAGAFKNFLVLSNAYGFAPLTTTANLFSSDTAFTINDIFHFANATINGDIINSPNVILTGAGALTLLGGVSNPTGNGQGSFGASAAGGVTLIGQGSSFDYVFYNSAGNAVCSVATGTRTQNCNTVGSTNPFIFNGTPGITQTCTVDQTKTLVFTGGILTSGSCNS